MADPIIIQTGKYKRDGKIEIDGMVWTVKLPGAATELKMSQMQRRIKFLDKKIESGSATEADLDKYDEYELEIYGIFRGMFRDSTEDNSEVNKWLDETPLAIIIQVFEDIKEQANGRTEQTSSTG